MASSVYTRFENKLWSSGFEWEARWKMTSNTAWGLWVKCEWWIPERLISMTFKIEKRMLKRLFVLKEKEVSSRWNCSSVELGLLICEGLQRGRLGGNLKFHLLESAFVINVISSLVLVGCHLVEVLDMRTTRWRRGGRHRPGMICQGKLWGQLFALQFCQI